MQLNSLFQWSSKSSIAWDLRRKSLHYAAERFFNPLHVSIWFSGNGESSKLLARSLQIAYHGVCWDGSKKYKDILAVVIIFGATELELYSPSCTVAVLFRNASLSMAILFDS